MKGLLLLFMLVAVLSLSATPFEPPTTLPPTSETALQADSSAKANTTEDPDEAVQAFTIPQRTDRTWDGSFSSAWSIASNWTPAGVPVAGDAVTINMGATPYPIITSAVNATCTSVYLASGATLSIQGTLSVTGGFTNYGSVTLQGTLTTGADLYEYGNLNFTNEIAVLTINDDLRCFSGGSLTYAPGLLDYPDITVKGDLVFNTGSSINLTHGKVVLSGTTQNIYTYAAATLYGLSVNSTNCYFNSGSTQSLTVTSTFQVPAGKHFYGNADVTTYLNGYISVGTGAVMQFTVGTVNLSGNANANITTVSGNYFNNLTISKGSAYHVLLNSDITVNGDLTINSGALWPANDIFIQSDWTNNAGTSGFREDLYTSSSVIFFGPNTQQIYTSETFNIIFMEKTGGMLSIPFDSEVTCQNYIPNSPVIGVLYINGTFNVNYSNFNALSQGPVWLFGGTLNYHHNDTYTLDIGADIEITNGTFNIYGATDATLNSSGSLQMGSGELNFHDANVTLASGFGTTITGGYLKAAHDLTISDPAFNPTLLMIYLYGDFSSTLSMAAGARLDNLKIIKGSSHTVSATSDIYITGALHVEAGMFDTNRMDITVDTYTIIYGTLNITYATTFAQGGEFVVGPDGKLKIWGISTNNAIFTHSGTGYYTFTVQSGGIISALYTIFEYMNVSGINLQDGSLVEVPYSFQHCTFRNGAGTGTLLTINNNQNLALYDVTFPANTWGGSWSVSKTSNQGNLKFYSYLGGYGPNYELDSYNRIIWYPNYIPAVTDLAISPDPNNVNQVRLNWTYPIYGAKFNLFSSDLPYNNFTYIGYTHSSPVSLMTSARKFYFIQAELTP
jgi:hypothetical protein